MPRLMKEIGKVAATLAVIVIAFIVHWGLGAFVILLIVGYLVYANRSILYANKGNLAYMKGDEAKALMYMEKAYQMKSVYPQHQIGYGYLLLKTGKLAQAEEVFQKVIQNAKSRDDMLKAKVNLSTVYWLQNKREEALELLEDVYKDFKTSMVYGNLGYFKLLNGQLDEALELNLAAYEYNSDDLTIMDNLAQNYFMLGQLNDAKEMYEKVMAKSPKNSEPYYYYARTLQQLGNLEEAREQATKGLEKKPALVPSVTRQELEQLSEQLGAGAV